MSKRKNFKTLKINMNVFVHRFGFSGFYALTYGIASAIAAIILFHDAVGDG